MSRRRLRASASTTEMARTTSISQGNWRIELSREDQVKVYSFAFDFAFGPGFAEDFFLL